MQFEATQLPEVILIKPRVFGDARGFFFETWQARAFDAAGIDARFVQGQPQPFDPAYAARLHFQIEQPQGKLVRVARGAVFDVCRGYSPQLAALWQVDRRHVE